MENPLRPFRRFFINVAFLAAVLLTLALVTGAELMLDSSFLSASSIVLALGVVGFMAVVLMDLYVQRQHYRARKKEFRKFALKNAKLRQRANIQAQLNKPEFERRLENFTGVQSEIDTAMEPAKSKAEFWEASDLDLGPTAPRPIEFFRVLLQRISKYVGFAK